MNNVQTLSSTVIKLRTSVEKQWKDVDNFPKIALKADSKHISNQITPTPYASFSKSEICKKVKIKNNKNA